MLIYEWAKKWGISYDAVRDLQQMSGALNTVPDTTAPRHSEAWVQQQARLAAARTGAILWRNNVGVLKDDRGVPVRYGLANDTKALNERIKSCDLIGIKPVLITHDLVGHTIGQFFARECKPEGWVYTATEHEQAQLSFITLANAHGADAKFTNGGGL